MKHDKEKDNIVEEHDEVIKSAYVEHYEDHERRTESALFRKTKKHMHELGAECWIGNGRCEGNIEIHHDIIEYSASTEVDWEKVQKDHPGFTDVDQEYQMIALCAKHHRHKGFGKHCVPEPIWKLQKYMTEEALDDFENAVYRELYNGEKPLKK